MMTVQVTNPAGILRRSDQPGRQTMGTIVVLSRETGDARHPVDVIVESFIYAMRWIVATGGVNVFDRVFLSHFKNSG